MLSKLPPIFQGWSYGVFNINATQTNDTGCRNEVFSHAQASVGVSRPEFVVQCYWGWG